MSAFLDSTSSFHIESTRVTPHVAYHSDNELLEIKGVSSPDNTPSFYAPVFAFIESIPSYNINHLQVRFALLYFNSSSAKAFYTMLKKLKDLSGIITFSIDWICDEDDEDMIESIEDFNDLLGLEIQIVIEKENSYE